MSPLTTSAAQVVTCYTRKHVTGHLVFNFGKPNERTKCGTKLPGDSYLDKDTPPISFSTLSKQDRLERIEGIKFLPNGARKCKLCFKSEG